MNKTINNSLTTTLEVDVTSKQTKRNVKISKTEYVKLRNNNLRIYKCYTHRGTNRQQ